MPNIGSSGLVLSSLALVTFLASGCGGPDPDDPPVALCGNGALDPGEVCDDGQNDGRYGGCAAGCTSLGPYCGDGVLDQSFGERCDDGVNDALGGGCLPGCSREDTSQELFDAPLLEVTIDMAPEDWDALRHQRKTRHSIFGSEDCRNQVIVNPYTYVPGEVRIDGHLLTSVGVRKKGHLGSQSTRKPSLKLKFDEYAPDQEYLGLDRLSLNNSKSDSAYARTCLSYQVFAAAGIPAPRCSYAHVTVNGDDLGVYVVVEEIKKRFLARHFADPEGTLYEGTACDFRPEFFGGFEQETNTTTDPSRADLEAVYQVVANAPDESFAQELAAYVDIDQLYRFWAVESLIWHRDGYSGNANNYFLYNDPADGKLRFLPWGPDSAFRPDNRSQVPDSVLAFGAITYRLYQHPATRDRYYTELWALIDQVWDEAALLAEVERVAGIIGPYLPLDEQASFPGAVAELESTISERRGVIESALQPGPPEWTSGMRSLPCRIPQTAISGTFDTTWDTLGQNIFTAGSGTLDLILDGTALTFTAMGARAGVTGSGGDRVQMIADTDDGRRFNITADLPAEKYFDPYMIVGDHPLDSPPVTMNVTESDISVSPQVVLRRFDIGEGVWTFEQVGETAGQAVTGGFQGTLYLRP